MKGLGCSGGDPGHEGQGLGSMMLACPNRGGRHGGGKSCLATEVRRRSLTCGTRERRSAREKEK
ncbi:hypothetical protein DEO72_LG6g2324 [Vigna unguiculata]|uniref:Uncharacterized protein n=1 Tax=Vigna unguiculata TaxID=3917 RepID=A0A4D6M9W1_VIGUN|nr:hypothetical protein DEO72_LG6g2324 [Vigna unguiculata]